eukprot:1156341-Pelagomonas_calceolata.AAC.3
MAARVSHTSMSIGSNGSKGVSVTHEHKQWRQGPSAARSATAGQLKLVCVPEAAEGIEAQG